MAFVTNASSTTEAQTSKGKKAVKETSATLAESNRNRIGLYVCNPSAKEVWLALGATAAKEEGIWLKKEGGTAIISEYTGVVSCVTSEGEGTITFAEA